MRRDARQGGPLDRYVSKRDFTRTPEPPGVMAAGGRPDDAGQPAGAGVPEAGGRPSATGPAPAAGPPPVAGPFPRFVVQEHHASRLHWDLRLEAGGVLKSWAVPKGIPNAPGEKRLAVEVEDHPLDYISFQGTIPQGSYGAGEVIIWDQGVYAPSAMTDRKVTFAALGEKMNGAYKLVRMDDKNWLLMMLADGRTPPGDAVLPGGGTRPPSPTGPR